MDLTTAIKKARALHDQIYTDLVAIDQHTGTTPGPLGTRTDVWEQVYHGPGLVQPTARDPHETDSAGRPVTVTTHIGKVPATVVLPPRTRYRVRVLESLDPGNLGTYEGGLTETAESNAWAITRRMHLHRS